MKELTTAKRYAVGNVNLVESDQGGSEVTEYRVVPESLAPVLLESGPAAHDVLPIRVIKVLIEDAVEAEAILDQGAVVCIIREDVWEKLGIHLDPDHAMTLEAADAGKSSTLGRIRDARFRVAGVDLKLQVQVVSVAPFEVLLGRPFFALTKCETKDFLSGDQHITITDPRDRNRRSKVSTGIRAFWRAPESGFHKSRN